MTSRKELASILNRTPRRDRAILHFVALLGAESGLGDQPIVVGGSAVEIYPQGGYASGDVDLIGSSGPLEKALADWGFQKKGRYWVDDELSLFVDIPGRYYNGDVYRTQLLTTPYGRVRLAEPEYLIVRRLAAAKYWNDPGALDEAALLAVARRSDLDWGYAAELAKREHVEELIPVLTERVTAVTRRSDPRGPG